jgi:hypothetical protein
MPPHLLTVRFRTIPVALPRAVWPGDPSGATRSLIPGGTAGLSAGLWGYEVQWYQIVAIALMALNVLVNIVEHGNTIKYDALRSIIAVSWWATILGIGGFWNFH